MIRSFPKLRSSSGLHYAFSPTSGTDMANSFAGKRDLTTHPLAVVMAVLILFWGSVAVLLWRVL